MIQTILQRAVECHRTGDLVRAESLCREVLKHQPDLAIALNLLGFICQQVGRIDEGIALLERSVAADPSVPGHRNNLAVALGSIGRLQESAAVLRKGIELRPEYLPFQRNLGVTLERLGDVAAACEAYRQALAREAKDPAICTSLAGCQAKLNRIGEAETSYRQAIDVDPGYVPAWDNLAKLLRGQCRQREGTDAMRRAVALKRDDAAMHSNLLYALHYDSNVSRDELFAEHRRWAAHHEAPLRAGWRPHDNERTSTRRLRVGYVSPDFRRHSVATFFEPLLANHNHEQFEIILYSAVAKPDETTARLRSMSDGFRDISKLGDAEAAEMIRRDRVDILIDLTGHMGGNRLLTFARKPAPIQVTYVGHPNTTGMEAMDYRMTDGLLDPPDGPSDRLHSEKLIRLPGVFGCYMPPAEIGARIPPSRPPFIQTDVITFGCLNNPSKVTPEVLHLWCQILQAVPRSRLLMLGHAGAPSVARIFTEAGISPDRVRIVRRLNCIAYFQAFEEIDLALDPFPYNGQTTSCDGLWMGVPLVALLGNSYVSRMGADLLYQLNLGDLVATTSEDYVRIAVALAGDAERRIELRRSLREQMTASALGNGALLAKHIEQAYRSIWTHWCCG